MTVSGTESYTTSYTYDANNRLQTEAKTGSCTPLTTSYTYDANGNMLSKITISSVSTEASHSLYSYDGFNRQAAANVNGTQATYSYNARGIRICKTVGSKATSYLLSGGNVVGEVVDGALAVTYMWGVNLICRTASNSKQYYLYNAHGDVVALTNTLGLVAKTYDYDAFGVERNLDEDDANPFRYCGEYYDAETGTYYLRARYYDPALGRFTQEDAIRSGLNWYTYCANNPVSFIDPSGCYYLVKDRNGQYYAQKQSEGDAIIKSTFSTGYRPFLETLCGREVVGGTSAGIDASGVLFQSYFNDAKAYINGVVVPYASSIHPVLGAAASIVGSFGDTIWSLCTSLPGNLSIANRDDILWRLFDINGIDPSNSSLSTLSTRMSKADAFVQANEWLLTEKLSGLNMTAYDAGKLIAEGSTSSLARKLRDYYYDQFVYIAYKEIWGCPPLVSMSIANTGPVQIMAESLYNAFQEQYFSNLSSLYNSTNDYFIDIFNS